MPPPHNWYDEKTLPKEATKPILIKLNVWTKNEYDIAFGLVDKHMAQ